MSLGVIGRFVPIGGWTTGRGNTFWVHAEIWAFFSARCPQPYTMIDHAVAAGALVETPFLTKHERDSGTIWRPYVLRHGVDLQMALDAAAVYRRLHVGLEMEIWE